MSQEPPKLAQLNLMVDDMAASLDFYRRLGVATADGEGGPHAEPSLPGGLSLELDAMESARLWHAGVRADPASGRYAIVADPSGNDVGLMSPVDESMRSWPPEESPG
jgi:catechol 2,3-dioxygenase-like lactoylglutathione lyase family enzyme